MQTKVEFMKQLLVLCILIFGLKITYAQSNFRLGLTASPTISWLSPDTRGVESEGNRIGFKYGVIADFNFAENYAFSTGIFMNYTGGKISFPSISTNSVGATDYGKTESVIKLQYIEIPLTLKLRTNEIGYITYFGQIGFGVSINIGAKSDLEVTNAAGNTLFKLDDEKISDEINLFQSSLIIGAGAEYNVSGNTAILIGLTYHNGFTNVLDFKVPKTDRNGTLSTSGETQSVKGTNNYVSLTLGVLF